MIVTLDGNNLFDSHGLEVELGSWHREQIERKVPGLDGVLSIDLGSRGRAIKQKGILRARSDKEMEELVERISDSMDGRTHILAMGNVTLENVRIDSFKTGQKCSSGNSVCCDYEIIYKQLRS